MTNDQFNTLVNSQIDKCKKTLLSKKDEYADPAEDRLSHFKEAAALMGTAPEMALLGMASKHFISVAKLCREADKPQSLDLWDEKIGDAINYLLILSAMIRRGE